MLQALNGSNIFRKCSCSPPTNLYHPHATPLSPTMSLPQVIEAECGPKGRRQKQDRLRASCWFHDYKQKPRKSVLSKEDCDFSPSHCEPVTFDRKVPEGHTDKYKFFILKNPIKREVLAFITFSGTHEPPLKNKGSLLMINLYLNVLWVKSIQILHVVLGIFFFLLFFFKEHTMKLFFLPPDIIYQGNIQSGEKKIKIPQLPQNN